MPIPQAIDLLAPPPWLYFWTFAGVYIVGAVRFYAIIQSSLRRVKRAHRVDVAEFFGKVIDASITFIGLKELYGIPLFFFVKSVNVVSPILLRPGHRPDHSDMLLQYSAIIASELVGLIAQYGALAVLFFLCWYWAKDASEQTAWSELFWGKRNATQTPSFAKAY